MYIHNYSTTKATWNHYVTIKIWYENGHCCSTGKICIRVWCCSTCILESTKRYCSPLMLWLRCFEFLRPCVASVGQCYCSDVWTRRLMKEEQNQLNKHKVLYNTEDAMETRHTCSLVLVGGILQLELHVHCTIKCGHTHTCTCVHIHVHVYIIYTCIYHDRKSVHCTSNSQFCLGNLIMINQVTPECT